MRTRLVFFAEEIFCLRLLVSEGKLAGVAVVPVAPLALAAAGTGDQLVRAAVSSGWGGDRDSSWAMRAFRSSTSFWWALVSRSISSWRRF